MTYFSNILCGGGQNGVSLIPNINDISKFSSKPNNTDMN